MILTQKKLNIFNRFIFILIFSLRAITDGLYISRGVESNFLINFEFYILILAFIFLFIQVSLRKQEKIFKSELRSVLFVSLVFAIITLIFYFVNGFFYKNSIIEIIKLIIPIVYAFLILNTLDFEDIYKAFIFILIFSYIGLILEVGLDTFNINSIMSISFEKSYSPFESNYFAGTAIALCVFFMYYRKNKFLTFFSLLLVLLTFKRVSVVFALFLFLLPFFVDINKKVKNRYKFLICLLFVSATLLYYHLLLPSSADLFMSIFGKSQVDFSMSRSNFLLRLLNCGYPLRGFGTTTILLGKSMELDLIKIYLETTLVGLIAFIYCYTKVCGNHIYLHFYILYLLTNLLTSHSLANYFGWALAFIICGCINYKQSSNLSYLKYKKRKDSV